MKSTSSSLEGSPHNGSPFESQRFNSFAVIKIATTPQAAITNELYVEVSDSSLDIVEEDAESQVANEEEICDEIIQDRLNSLFEIASELPSNNASATTEQPREVIQDVQSGLTLGAEIPDISTTGGTYRSVWNATDSTTLPEYSSNRVYHIVVLGVDGVGKSCLTAQFALKVWIESYESTIDDSYRKQIQVDGRYCMLEILDTAGEEQSTAMREVYIKSAQGFLLVFSITSLSSFDELAALRDQIILIKNDPLVPLVIVGNKSDLEEDRAVSRSRAFQVSQSWNNAPYYETSARARRNVDEAFIDLCRQMFRKDVPTQQVREMERHNRGYKDGLRRATKKIAISRASSKCNII